MKRIAFGFLLMILMFSLCVPSVLAISQKGTKYFNPKYQYKVSSTCTENPNSPGVYNWNPNYALDSNGQKILNPVWPPSNVCSYPASTWVSGAAPACYDPNKVTDYFCING